MRTPHSIPDILLVLLTTELARTPERDTRAPKTLITIPLRAHIQRLNVRGFERLIARLFEALGYQDVKILRDHQTLRRSHKGRNRHGGIDLSPNKWTVRMRGSHGKTDIDSS